MTKSGKVSKELKKSAKKMSSKVEICDPEALAKNKQMVETLKKKLSRLADEFDARCPEGLP
eukprot:CAMPEP_0171655234 /NCGR_PEP_ID=MMETSP0990-20121206/40749_1 /TAXON_ID=483369 /ORGANISM="non described non described, Strain CCMP2098" /LENGTH=60 /DNA_ID=CAMNT_0012235247 /DNA_START=8 /DNA_END=190 /DNA_ORIENTATION=+